MKKTRRELGITLVALIITIVVLLILAVVAITSVTNTGIINYANNSAAEYLNAQKNENTFLAEYESYLEQNAAGTSTGGIAAGAYTVGQSVTLTDKNGVSHEFWVIEASAADATTVKLLAKERIDTTTLLQSASASSVAFSSTNYWSSVEGIKYPCDLVETGVPESGHTAALAAYNYGAKFTGATGRLMYKSEADVLKTTNADVLYGKASTNGYVIYWLGATGSSGGVYYVIGNTRSYGSKPNDYTEGVRPVLIVSKF